MTSLYLPPHIARENRIRHQRRMLRCVTTDDPRCQYYTTRLKLRSEGMWMVRAHDTVDADLPLWPGYYHIFEINDNGDLNAMPVHNGGKYVEPGDWIYEQLDRMNLRERRVRDRLTEVEREEREAGERELQEANENRRERLTEIVQSATRAQISMDRTLPWTQNSQGRRDR